MAPMPPPTPTPVRRPAAGLLRRAEKPDDVRAVPGERHPRPRHPARAARGGRRALLRASAAAARSTTRTARFIAALEEDLASTGIDLPVYWGNRNWDPYLADTLRADGGRRRHAGPPAWSPAPTRRTPAAGSTARTSPTPSPTVGAGAPRLDQLRHYFNHPGFVEPMVDATLAALAELPRRRPAATRTCCSSPTRSRRR